MYNAKETEEKILGFWEAKQIYGKLKKKNSKGKKFYMMDGPPYATGHIHMGTALNKILKDIALRSKRLQGYNVFDKAGYDTHGVPIEFQIEKEINSKSRKDIEKFGIKKFIQKCKEFATKYIDVMNKEFENLGAWMDYENAYLTLTNNYIETIWDTFKKADEKNLLYLSKYPVHACPRCETAVAYNEIEYSKQDDTSIYVKFPLKNEKNKFLVIWTTTAWTLPGNTGIMANPNFEYVEIELSNGEMWILAEQKVPELMKAIETGYTIKKKFKGKDMQDWKYENPLSKNLNLKVKNGYKVVLSERYVNLEEGTGLVHCAPGHGKEDYEVGKKYNLDILSPVSINGLMTKEAGKYQGKKARIVDEEIIEDLEKGNFLVYKHKYTHDYPLCWRCKSPLLMISLPQWFFKIDKIQKKLLEENEKVNWIPKHMKLRMKAWLEGISDWPISRNRYWGTPLPIWICDKCNKKEIIGSIKQLEKNYGKRIKEVHKPEIDEVKWKCKCSGEMTRVPEVLDVWFDSGVSSWAALNYPQDDKLFKKFWPADLNIEGRDQVRGWWNSQIILSEIKFGKKPFDSILVHGMVLDLEKVKMSKSLGNIISPPDVIRNYGRDYLRYYFAKTSKGEDFAFSEAEIKKIEKIFRILLNVNNFVNQLEKKKSKFQIEDRWILSRFNSLIKEVKEDYNSFRVPGAIQKLENFLVEDLSRNYIQFTREREDETYNLLNEIRLNLLKFFSPIVPFITESIWQELKKDKVVKEESVHLSSWSKPDNKKINKKLEQDFEIVRKIMEVGLAERDKAKIGLKWPLSKAIVSCDKKLNKKLEEIIKRQLNVKKLEIKIRKRKEKVKEIKIELDTKITPELESEGYAREIIRKIQDARKKAGLEKKDKIELAISSDKEFLNILKSQEKFIKQRTNAQKIILEEAEKKKYKHTIDEKIKDKRVKIGFSKL